jgi:muramoyltetrapeptide carboxypeptidase
MRMPNFLNPGDEVAIVAPSGPPPLDRLEKALESVREFGLAPILFPSCVKKRGYLAGTDADRARDLSEAFALPDAKAVICIRGGYGAQRLLNLVDFDVLAETCKPLYGYSDITALHLEMNKRGVISWHTPMPGSEWYSGLDKFTCNSVRAALFGPLPKSLVNPADAVAISAISPGRAEGILCGGNLSLVASSLGTFYEFDAKEKIIFLEDVDEYPHRVDRMLLQLRNAGKFRDCAGVVFGTFTDCNPKDAGSSLTIDEILADLTGDINRPVLSGLQCGHVLPTLCLPLGARVSLDADNAELKVLGV